MNIDEFIRESIRQNKEEAKQIMMKKKQERISELLAKSGLGKRFRRRTFENFEIKDKNQGAYNKAIEFAGEFPKTRKGLLITGPVGTGKTHLAAAMEIFVNGSLNLFNHRTNVDLKNRFIVFDLSGLKDNLRITSMLIMMETVKGSIKANSGKKRWTHLYIDEFHELLGVEQVAGFILKLWKEIRKMNGILTGITQNMSDLLNSENGGRLQAILSNTEYFALLSQSTLDKNKLMQFLPSISPAMFNFVDNADSGTGLLKMGSVTVPFDMRMSKDSEIYRIVNTDGGAYGV